MKMEWVSILIFETFTVYCLRKFSIIEDDIYCIVINRKKGETGSWITFDFLNVLSDIRKKISILWLRGKEEKKVSFEAMGKYYYGVNVYSGTLTKYKMKKEKNVSFVIMCF